MWDKHPKDAVGCRKSWGCEPKQGRGALEHPAELSLWTRPEVQPGGVKGLRRERRHCRGNRIVPAACGKDAACPILVRKPEWDTGGVGAL